MRGCWLYLCAFVVQQLVQVLDGEVAHADGLDLACLDDLLQFLPRVDEIPVLVDGLLLGWVARGRPVHKIQVEIVRLELL